MKIRDTHTIPDRNMKSVVQHAEQARQQEAAEPAPGFGTNAARGHPRRSSARRRPVRACGGVRATASPARCAPSDASDGSRYKNSRSTKHCARSREARFFPVFSQTLIIQGNEIPVVKDHRISIAAD
ncbi:hypothetical protein ACVK00_004946 [Burkholderia sp. PvR073]